MYTLFIDTHYKDILLYLYKDNKLLNKKELKDVSSTSIETMPALNDLLDKSNIKVNDLNKIAVCIGPGSFTGTRLGVTIAKTLAYSLNIDIVSLTSLDLIALNLDEAAYVSQQENNGAFIAYYNAKLGDIKYMKQEEYEEFKKSNKVLGNTQINDIKLIEYINTLKPLNVHDVNPLYIKNIEGIKND